MKIAVLKKTDDPLAVRISIGGFKTMGNEGYLVYRGNLDEVKMLLGFVSEALKQLNEEPEISSDNGKKYA